MNLPKEATSALIDFLGASRRYSNLTNALGVVDSVSATETYENPRAMAELQATVRDAEQALLAIFTAVLGEPDVTFPEEQA